MSVAPYISIVEAIAGNEVQCVPIVPEGEDPHTFSPTLAQSNALEKARVWLLTGEPFEAKCVELIGGKCRATVLDLRTTCSLLPAPSSCGHGHTPTPHHRDDPHALSLMDTHLWLSPTRLIAQSKAIAHVLAEQFPHWREIFRQNLDVLIEQLSALDVHVRQCVFEQAQRALLVSHPALTYFCADYQLEQLSAEVEGRDPTPKQQSKLLQAIRDKRIDRIFVLQPHSDRAALQLAELYGLKIVTLDPYNRNIQSTLQQICAGLSE